MTNGTTQSEERAMSKHVEQKMPVAPSAALKRLERLVGQWSLKGRNVGSNKDTIVGATQFEWLYGPAGKSFFLMQEMEMDYDGKSIKSHELIGYDPKTKAFASLVFSNMAPDPWPYQWDVQAEDISISIRKGPMNATFRGRFAPDGNSFSGGWRPNPGADPAVNTSYDVVATRKDKRG
jgi:hypothetical protein